jgi:hypothetical protein
MERIREQRRAGWKEADLGLRRKGDAVKVEPARCFRRETTPGWLWIARRFQMGSWTYVSNLLREKH